MNMWRSCPELGRCTYGIGAQILRELHVTRMKALGHARHMPGMTGFSLCCRQCSFDQVRQSWTDQPQLS
jgi:GTP cyclohydrolase II